MLLDTTLESNDLATEVHYLIADLRDLEGMENIRFEERHDIRGDEEIRIGIKFEVDIDMLESILRRLHDRLYYSGNAHSGRDTNPLETLFLLQINNIKLEIRTHKAEDLIGLWVACQNRILLPAQSDYLAEVETYARTEGGLSPTEEDNLELKRRLFCLLEKEAEQLRIKAAGLYRTKEARRSYFEETTRAEFSRLGSYFDGLPIAHKEIWPVLQELAENLGLPTSEAEVIYQDHRQRYDEVIQLKEEQKAAKADEDARLAAEAEHQKQVQQAQLNLNQYRSLCHQTMANALYPSEFDQGRLAQLRLLLAISREEASTIEAAVRDQLYGGVESAAGVDVDYTRLRGLLHQQAWLAADLETEAVMLKALNRDMQPVTAATVQSLPSVDLATIDALWSRYSNGRFGFKAQQQVHRGQQQIQADDHKRWVVFEETLGWRKPSSWFYRGFQPYHDLTFSLEAPPGHLPTWRWCCVSLGHRYSISPQVMEAVMAYLNESIPPESAVITALEPTLAAGDVNRAS